MTRIVLVHGAGHGAWCWDKLVPRLTAFGHQMVTLDLPGHGADRQPIETIAFSDYAARVVEVVQAQPEPVVLVGHSMGGVVISQAAERCPEKIAALVYLSAMLPDMSGFIQALSGQGAGLTPLMTEMMDVSADQHQMSFKPSRVRELLYQDCAEADVAQAIPRLVPVVSPLGETTVLGANYESVPRYYLECTQDRAIPLGVQRAMVQATPVRRVISLDCGHSGFFSQPTSVAMALDLVVEDVRDHQLAGQW